MDLDSFVTAIILIASFYILFFLGKLANDLLHREYDLTKELVEKDNPALALGIAGYYLGLVLAIGGALAGPDNGIAEDLIDLFIYGFLAIILINFSWFFCDKLILYKFKVSDELIRDRNQGVGAVVCGVNIASGLIVFGAVTGEGGNIWTAAAFWALGQILLLLAVLLYNLITPYNIHKELEEKDNVAVGVGVSGALISMGIIIGLSASIDFNSWYDDIFDFVSVAAMGLVMLPIVRFLTDKILLPTVKLTDEIVSQEIPNVGAAYIEALSYIGAAFIIKWCV